MQLLRELLILIVFPGGLGLILGGLAYEWAGRKLTARLQNRYGPRLIQPLADLIKLLGKVEIVPVGVNPLLFHGLPLVALAGALTAGLYVPLAGLSPAYGFPGDLIVTVYLLSLLTLCTGLAGLITIGQFSRVGAARALTQLFAYEAPLLLALLGPALAAGTWQIGAINQSAAGTLFMVAQPVGFVVALIGLMGKIELPPFDAPEAETEIVAGALTEYSGRGLAFFRLCRSVELLIGLTLISAFFLGGVQEPISFLIKTLALLTLTVGLRVLITRLRIDQTVLLWWRWGALLMLLQILWIMVTKG
ncbi:MAG: NADH-quinone oxidoreductase subunit H [Anaerolinea sp.]|nr:NADH-quinone oxidoreductase subunit H [Anaerolinea sp.]MCC6973407.1 NADH-quinone oxidoreductase subunit H [Anaerolineae bacterium]CAG1010835.1 NADH-quinone oxidoreductase subunit H [Anaerolineae bacterium]